MNPYREEERGQATLLFAGYQAPVPSKAKRQPKHEYEYYIAQTAKLIGERYYVLHSRLEKAFDGRTPEYILSKVREWYHAAEKSENKGRCFNGLFKQWREKGV